jgi:hypothetical protein
MTDRTFLQAELTPSLAAGQIFLNLVSVLTDCGGGSAPAEAPHLPPAMFRIENRLNYKSNNPSSSDTGERREKFISTD